MEDPYKKIQKSCNRSTLDIGFFHYAFSLFELSRKMVLVGTPDRSKLEKEQGQYCEKCDDNVIC